MPPPAVCEQKRAEIAGRFNHFKVSCYELAAEYRISQSTVRKIGKEYKDREHEAVEAANLYNERNPRPVQNATSYRNSVPQLTQPSRPGLSADGAMAMPTVTALQGRVHPVLQLSNEDFWAIAVQLLQLPHNSWNTSPIQEPRPCGHAEPGNISRGGPAVSIDNSSNSSRGGSSVATDLQQPSAQRAMPNVEASLPDQGTENLISQVQFDAIVRFDA